MNNQQLTLSPGVIFQIALIIIVIPLLPLLISWQWAWWEAWINAVVFVLVFIISRWLAHRRHPDLLAERAASLQKEDAKAWDRVLGPIAGLGSGIILIIVGLDALFRWSTPFSLPLKILALLAILGGYAFSTYAIVENRFFSGLVRIQTDRGHHVISTGPYRWVRHPGYAGIIPTYFAMPIFLDAWWALIPAVFMTIVLIIRTSLEDKTLHEELPGYADYALKVRYRLLPGVW